MFNLLEPSQPKIEDWGFVDELKSVFHRKPHWNRTKAYPKELDFSKGITIIKDYPDPEGLLDTAWQDLERFFEDISIPKTNCGIRIEAVKEEQDGYESYCIEVSEKYIKIKSGDTEGLRRAIFYLEDLILSSEGPFLAPTLIKRKPWVKNRVSRCFFGPIKRPPLNRDELMDEVDYYPDEYLNRLAHEGINILWITVEFRDVCKTNLVPEYGKYGEKRLNKLRQTVAKCRRYGIKIFIFAIEPRIWGPEDPLLLNNPEVAGAASGSNICFCPFTETSNKYLYEAVRSIFIKVPKLGGIMSITHGERTTSCLSSVSSIKEADVACPRCSKKEKSEILEATHKPIIKAMQEINPDAQFISWLYMPYKIPNAKWIFTIPEKLPKETILAFNFESGGKKEQLGRIVAGGDYWQSYVGPSCRFERMAKASKKAGIGIGAKIQVGCSHEVATIPFVPVPSILWKKYRAMYDLNVSSVIQSWFFGNYPGIMNKAAGELGFEDWGSDTFREQKEVEYDFLYRLAKIDWGNNALHVVKAWQYFSEGYSNYPMSGIFQYYGPLHDGIVWPLYLFPKHTHLAPTWRLDYSTSGDSIGECMIVFSIRETIKLCKEMVKHWEKGLNILKDISFDYQDNLARLKDIGVAEALGIQFKSGVNILRFYDLREQILWNRSFNQTDHEKNSYGHMGSENKSAPFSRIKCLDEMARIVKDEIKQSARMIELCKFDSRLGFHSEAEGYKYFPEKLLWRIKQLESLLEDDFPRMREMIQHEKNLARLTTPLDAPLYSCSNPTPAKAKTFQWTARVENRILFISIICSEVIEDNTDNVTLNNIENRIHMLGDQLYLHIKAGDLGYPYNLVIDLNKARNTYNFSSQDVLQESHLDPVIGSIICGYKIKNQDKNLIVEIEVDYEKMPGYRGQSALAISIVRNIKTDLKEIQDSWSGKNPHVRPRLCLGGYNPEAMGRLELT
jgi:hypothetical protein